MELTMEAIANFQNTNIIQKTLKVTLQIFTNIIET